MGVNTMRKVTYIQLDGQDLYKLRVFILNFSLQKMAECLDCSASLLCRIERGSLGLTPTMSMQVIELIKKKCGFNPEDTEENFIKNYLLESELRA